MMLEQEIEKYLSGQTLCNCDSVSYRNIKNLILGFAEPREKQIQIDAEQIRALQKQNGELTDKVNDLEEKLANADYQLEGRDNEISELKAQIEKMKCCYNCSKWYDGECEESPKSKTFFCADFKCDNWEIADD